MKYLVNRETKEHKVATPLAESIIKGYPDFKDDWQLVEADSEGWIPWSGGECPLPDDCRCEIKTESEGGSMPPSRAKQWFWREGLGQNTILAYRPILAEQEPGNHLSEEATRAINEGIRRRFEEARTVKYSDDDLIQNRVTAGEESPTPVTAANILKTAIGHMEERAVTYDNPQGERSMGKTVAMFNALTEHGLSEEQGWLFMVCLKMVRSQQGDYRSDSYEDGPAYFALAGEIAAKERGNDET